MSLIGNLGPILSGITMTTVSNFAHNKIVNDDEKALELSLKILTLCIVFAGGLIAALHRNVYHITLRERAIEAERSQTDKKVVPHKGSQNKPVLSTKATAAPLKEKKVSITLFDSLKILSSNSYLRDIAIMVLAYGMSIELTEIIWKSAVKKALPIKTEYYTFMGRYSTLVGVSAYIMMFIGSGVLNSIGWRAAALMTPAIMAVLAAPFYASILRIDLSNRKMLLTAVYVGLMQHVLSKASKYSIFDPMKEMAYIPLDPVSKTKGKAAIEVLGARLGKSAGAFIQQIIVLVSGDLLRGGWLIASLFYLVITTWIGKFFLVTRSGYL